MPLRLRLATFNLESLDASPGAADAFARRVEVLRPLLAQLDADVLCLQEVNAQKTDAHGPRRFLALDGLLTDTPYVGFTRAHTVAPAAGRPSDVHNLVTLSRWPIADSRQLFHDIVAGWRWQPPTTEGAPSPAVDITWDRPLLYCRIEMPDGAPLHVLNLHLRAPRAAHLPAGKNRAAWRSSAAWAEGLFVAIQKRAGQALEARLLVERLFDAEPAARLAVCGDLNADQHEMPIRLLQAAPGDIESNAFAQRALTPLEDRLAGLHRYSVVHAGRQLMLDHILASPTLTSRCVGIDVLNDGLVDETQMPPDYAGSLHAPLVAAFDLTTERTASELPTSA